MFERLIKNWIRGRPLNLTMLDMLASVLCAVNSKVNVLMKEATCLLLSWVLWFSLITGYPVINVVQFILKVCLWPIQAHGFIYSVHKFTYLTLLHEYGSKISALVTISHLFMIYLDLVQLLPIAQGRYWPFLFILVHSGILVHTKWHQCIKLVQVTFEHYYPTGNFT